MSKKRIGTADKPATVEVGSLIFIMISAQRVPEPDPIPGISFDTRPDPIQF